MTIIQATKTKIEVLLIVYRTKNNVHMGWLTFTWNPDKTGMIRTRQGDKGELAF